MAAIFTVKGKTRDGVVIQMTAYEQNKQDVKGIPAKVQFGNDPSMPCTLYFNETAAGAVIAELRGPVPRVDDSGMPILTIKDGRELYDFVSYKNEAGKDVWVETALGSFSVQKGKASGNNYIMGKMYVQHQHLDMARLLYAMRHPTEAQSKEKSIADLNAIQSNRANTYLVNVFPAIDSYSADAVSKLFKEDLVINKKPTAPEPSM